MGESTAPGDGSRCKDSATGKGFEEDDVRTHARVLFAGYPAVHGAELLRGRKSAAAEPISCREHTQARRRPQCVGASIHPQPRSAAEAQPEIPDALVGPDAQKRKLHACVEAVRQTAIECRVIEHLRVESHAYQTL